MSRKWSSSPKSSSQVCPPLPTTVRDLSNLLSLLGLSFRIHVMWVLRRALRSTTLTTFGMHLCSSSAILWRRLTRSSVLTTNLFTNTPVVLSRGSGAISTRRSRETDCSDTVRRSISSRSCRNRVSFADCWLSWWCCLTLGSSRRWFMSSMRYGIKNIWIIASRKRK